MSSAPSLAAARWRRRLRHLLLLPLALLLVLLEGVIWRGANALLRGLVHLPALAATSRVLSRLSGWAALPLFLLPEAAARVGELWTAVLLIEGHVVSAVLVYVLVRVAATLVAVFIWQACSAALLRLPWFARMVRWVTAARDWALAQTAPLRAAARRLWSPQAGALVRYARTLRRRWQAGR